jgi:hypothetical protein
MKPLAHARISAHRYGGAWTEYIALHSFFDSSKAVFASMQHRFFLHGEVGIDLAVARFGDTIGTTPTKTLALDHLEEDLGGIVALDDWLTELKLDLPRLYPSRLADMRADPIAGCIARFGGAAADYADIVAFFERPLAYSADPRARLVLANAFGIYCAEAQFGVARTIAGRLIATRAIAEVLVEATVGSIPSPGAIASRIRLTPWMRGAHVSDALRARASSLTDMGDSDDPR